jgi:hypothetical protein
MGKVITSPVPRFPGTVTLSDPLTFPQVFAFGDAYTAARALGEGATLLRVKYAVLPGLIACVEKWELGGGFPASPTPDTWPSTPVQAAVSLIVWLEGEISDLFTEAETVPLAS